MSAVERAIRDAGPFARLRASVERTGFRLLVGSESLRRRLAKTRSTPIDGRTLHPEYAAMLALDDMTQRSDLTALSPGEARARVATDVGAVNLPGPAMESTDRAIPSPSGVIPARLYTPSGLAAPSPGIVYLHGGGWVTCGVGTHDAFCRRLADGARCRVLSVEYRLAPEHPFPAAVDDALAATRFALSRANELGMDPSRIGVAGDSAGGNLSAVTALHLRNETLRPALQVLLYPALDLTCSTRSYDAFAERYFLTRRLVDWFLRHYAGGGDLRDPRISPLLDERISDVPALIYTAGFDVLRDEGYAYAERLKGAGTRVAYREFSDAIHGFVCMSAVTPALDAVNEIARDVGRELGARA
ncbi:MAG TPA: alpha/beta hydrolase [Polyangiaceae bacterium]|nr:alpha/beta hydrolase [Polyangiaceae bacterium]